MYEAYIQNSDFIKANLILCEDKRGDMYGYHQIINGRNMVYQVAQLLNTHEKQELRMYPVLEHMLQKLRMDPEDIKEMALVNLKRYSLIAKDKQIEELSRERRLYGRRK